MLIKHAFSLMGLFLRAEYFVKIDTCHHLFMILYF